MDSLYRHIEDLPQGIRKSLPPAGQRLFLAQFNEAWQGFSSDELNPAEHLLARQQYAHNQAWGAVKRQFEQFDGVWRPQHNKTNDA
jgi:cation transport regulator ChaB